MAAVARVAVRTTLISKGRKTPEWDKKRSRYGSFFYFVSFYTSSKRRAARFSFQSSIKFPTNQYGTANNNKKNMSQNPMVKIDRKAKNPKY